MSSENKQFTAEDLKWINEADDLHISPFRDDGVTYGIPTWVWMFHIVKHPYPK